MTPDMMTDSLARAQDRISALEAAAEFTLPLIESVLTEEITSVSDWQDARKMICAALRKQEQAA